jgi:hypothetical protein
MARREYLGVKDLGQNFQAFNDARPRAVKILIAIGDKDVIALHGLQIMPAGAMLKQRHFLKCSRYVETARVDKDDIRIGDNDLVPIEPGRRLARHCKEILTTRPLHEFWHPIAAGHQWVDPFDHGDPRALSRCATLLGDVRHALLQLYDQMLALPFAVKRAGDISDVFPDVGERVGSKRDDLYPPSPPSRTTLPQRL